MSPTFPTSTILLRDELDPRIIHVEQVKISIVNVPSAERVGVGVPISQASPGFSVMSASLCERFVVVSPDNMLQPAKVNLKINHSKITPNSVE